MVASMAIFAVEDLFLKWAATDLPPGQVIAMLGLAGAIAFGLAEKARGGRVLSQRFLDPSVVVRNLAEASSSLLWIVALAIIPLSLNSAILQAMPLAVTLGAVLFMGEKVGWRRWTAICVGFVGVLVILRPGTGGFQAGALLTVASVVVLAARDLATRAVPGDISTFQLTTWAYVALVPAGLLLMVILGDAVAMPTPPQWAGLAAALVSGILGYYGVTLAMRMGEVSAIAPYRYSRLVFSLIVAAIFLGERPDVWMHVGATLVVGSGLYAFARERMLRRRVAT